MPVDLVLLVKKLNRLPVVTFAAGGIATPADVILVMELGCDGVFEKLSNTDICNKTWEASLQPEDIRVPSTVHQRCGSAIDMVLHECVNEKTLDNITAVIIGFSNFEAHVDKARTSNS